MSNKFRFYLGIFAIALITLMLELVLTRVFEVILASNMAYLVITLAMFSLGAAGVFGTLRPISDDERVVRRTLATNAFLVAVFTLLLLPLSNILPYDVSDIPDAPVLQFFSFAAIYLAVIVPFFFLGLMFVTLFTYYSGQIQSLYFWDLLGAGLGCLVIVPLLPMIAPAGLLFCAAAMAIAVSGMFGTNRPWALASALGAIVLVILPFVKSPDYYEFRSHWDRRHVATDIAEGRREFSRWDPISKIDVINQMEKRGYKHVAYDGGKQSSRFYPFDGDLAGLRAKVESNETPLFDHFWFFGVLTSHYLKQDQNQDVLIIGAAGGQETKAALMYGAGHVDAVEMVGTVLELGSGPYNELIGGIYRDPRVTLVRGEGRSFLRSTDKHYDIIQMFSNHTSSSIASGNLGAGPAYLQTVEAYVEYFTHLKPNGILHINHHIYPKMVATAAKAWKDLGYPKDFRRHVVIMERPRDGSEDMLPTLLIKMSPWTDEEIAQLEAAKSFINEPFYFVADPRDPSVGMLTDDFFSGDFPEALAARIPYRIMPPTDNQPYYNFLRKSFDTLEPDDSVFLDRSTADIVNSMTRKHIPLDSIHLIITAVMSCIFALVFVVLPMLFSPAGRLKWEGRSSFLLYFVCLGFGFIVLELIFIQIFMKLIGFPLYTYSTVLFTMLLSAGVGSLCSAALRIGPNRRWTLPFLGILIAGSVILAVYPSIFQLALSLPVVGRILVAVAMIFPLGFFLGMPFPLGIMTLVGKPPGTVAWAWAMNAVFTVIGGYLSVVLSIFIGFQATVIVALSSYLVAFLAFYDMRRRAESKAEVFTETAKQSS